MNTKKAINTEKASIVIKKDIELEAYLESFSPVFDFIYYEDVALNPFRKDLKSKKKNLELFWAIDLCKTVTKLSKMFVNIYSAQQDKTNVNYKNHEQRNLMIVAFSHECGYAISYLACIADRNEFALYEIIEFYFGFLKIFENLDNKHLEHFDDYENLIDKFYDEDARKERAKTEKNIDTGKLYTYQKLVGEHYDKNLQNNSEISELFLALDLSEKSNDLLTFLKQQNISGEPMKNLILIERIGKVLSSLTYLSYKINVSLTDIAQRNVDEIRIKDYLKKKKINLEDYFSGHA